MSIKFPHRHLTEIKQLSAADITTIIDRAEHYASHNTSPQHHPQVLSGKTVITLFFESSTRTRTSFGLAAQRLGAYVTHIPIEQSSVRKGESVLDTVRTLDAMQVDALIIRHSEDRIFDELLPHVSASIVNAGDGKNEHPTQALLDALTMKKKFGKLEGLNVVICGDIEHSRVARSNIELLLKVGARPRIVAPSIFMPTDLDSMKVQAFDNLEDGLKDADVVMMLRIQHERLAGDVFSMSLKEYHDRFGLDHNKLKHAKPNAIVLHPGPVNRGVELSSSLMDDTTRSAILDQVRLGVAVRMACLELLIGQ